MAFGVVAGSGKRDTCSIRPVLTCSLIQGADVKCNNFLCFHKHVPCISSQKAHSTYATSSFFSSLTRVPQNTTPTFSSFTPSIATIDGEAACFVKDDKDRKHSFSKSKDNTISACRAKLISMQRCTQRVGSHPKVV